MLFAQWSLSMLKKRSYSIKTRYIVVISILILFSWLLLCTASKSGQWSLHLWVKYSCSELQPQHFYLLPPYPPKLYDTDTRKAYKFLGSREINHEVEHYTHKRATKKTTHRYTKAGVLRYIATVTVLRYSKLLHPRRWHWLLWQRWRAQWAWPPGSLGPASPWSPRSQPGQGGKGVNINLFLNLYFYQI